MHTRMRRRVESMIRVVLPLSFGYVLLSFLGCFVISLKLDKKNILIILFGEIYYFTCSVSNQCKTFNVP